MDGTWGDSAYDFVMEPDGDGDGGYGLGSGDPTRVKDHRSGKIRSDSGGPFDSRLEQMATSAPETLTLVCPVGSDEGLNSFGITKFAFKKKFDKIFRPDQPVFGCSNYKVVIDARSFAFRHLDASNLYFADGHVKLFSMGDFSEGLVNQLSRE